MCIIEIRPGQGGADALAFAATLSAAVKAWARRRGWPVSQQHPSGGRTMTVTLPAVPASAAA
jgi:protein subunit release factor B